MKTIKITGLLILGFILTWFPYQLNCLWYYTNRSLFDKIGRNFQLLLWNFASMANVMNPFLYAMFDYGPDIGDIVGCRWQQSAILYKLLRFFEWCFCASQKNNQRRQK